MAIFWVFNGILYLIPDILVASKISSGLRHTAEDVQPLVAVNAKSTSAGSKGD